MLPVILLVAGVATVVLASCSSDDGNKPHGTDDGGPDTDTIDTDTGTEDVDSGTDTDVDAGPDPWERDGFNGIFSDPKVGSNPCPVIDLDMDANRMRMMCSYPINRMGAIDLDSADPMNLDPLEATEAAFGSGNQNFIGMTLSGYGEVIPAQVQPLSNGYQMVPFFSSKDIADGGTYEISGLAFINGSGTVNTSLVDVISFSGDPALEIHPVSIASGVVSQDRLFLPATESVSGQGILLSYGINSDGTIDHNDVRLPVMTSGDEPASIAEVSSESVAVLNTSGASGATIDLITSNAGDPASAILNTISLGVDQAVPLPELPMTSDKHYAVVAGGTGSAMSNILIVDLAGHSVAGSVNLGSIGSVRGIAVRGNRAYVSLDDGTASASSGKVAIVNFSTPAAPVQEGTSVSVGYDLGAIAVHESCATFVAVTDPWWMDPETSETRWSHIVAFDPEIAAGVACGGI